MPYCEMRGPRDLRRCDGVVPRPAIERRDPIDFRDGRFAADGLPGVPWFVDSEPSV